MNDELVAQVRAFSKEHLRDPTLPDRDRRGEFSRPLWHKCGDFGLLGALIPEEFGGLALDIETAVRAFEEFGYGCNDGGLVFSAGTHVFAVTAPLIKFGTDEQKKRYLPRLATGEWIGIHAVTEPEAGSDIYAMKMRAIQRGNEFVISGQKTFATNAPEGDLAIVSAVTDPEKGYYGGITSFLIEMSHEGVHRGSDFETSGLRTAPLGELFLDDIVVPASAVLGGVGGGPGVFGHSMVMERTGIFSGHVGQMRRLLDQTLQYTRTRSQAGKPIAQHQVVSHQLVDMHVDIELSRLAVRNAASQLSNRQAAHHVSSLAKLVVSEALQRVARTALQLHGANGFATEYQIEREVRDSLAATLYSGTSEIQKNLLAGSLLARR